VTKVTREPDDWDDDERRALKGLESELEQLRARHRGDPPFDLLRAASADALPESVQVPLTEHLKESAWSRALVEDDSEEPSLDADGERRLLTRITRSARPARATWWSTRSWLPALAAAAVLILMVGVLRRGGSGPSFEQPPPRSADTPASSTPSASTPVFTLPLDKPEIKLTARALVLRSEGRNARFADDIAPALDALRANDYPDVDRRLAGLQARYPTSVEVVFYRAIAQLFLNDAAGAVVSLEAARRLDDGAFASEIGWYLAVAYERTGDIARARKQLDALCRQTSARQRQACEAVSKLTSR